MDRASDPKAKPDTGTLGSPGPAAWAALDRALPGVLVARAAVAVLVAGPLGAEAEGSGVLLAPMALTWLALVGAAGARAVSHAKASAGAMRAAWVAVPAVAALGLPLAVSFLADHRETEDAGTTCIHGLLPHGVPGALFGWIPWGAYVWLPAAAGLLGVGLLAAPSTRRPGAWALAATLAGCAMAIAGLSLIVNNCD